MKINNSQALIKAIAIKAEWVEITKEQFDENFIGPNGSFYMIGKKQIWSGGIRPIFLYCGDTKKYYAEKSIYEAMQPKRKEGWYRVKLRNAFYDKNKELVVYYNDSDNIFNCGCDPFEESDFEWIDDNPIEFPE